MRSVHESLAMRRILIVAITLVCSVARVPVVAAALDAKSLAKCHKSLNKAAQKIEKTKLSASAACADTLLQCALAEEIDGADFTACAAKATTKCDAKLAKIAAAQTKFDAIVNKKCAVASEGTVELNVVSRRGIGAVDARDACAGLVPPAVVDDMAAYGDCVARAALCRGDEALEAMIPRAHEVLDRAAVLAANSTVFPCLTPRAASPASGAVSAKDLLACQKRVHKETQKRAKTVAKSLFGCADALIACQLAFDRIETDLSGLTACLGKAQAKCDGRLAKATAAVAASDAKAVAKCSVPAADALSDLGFATICPGATDLNDLAACVRSAADDAVQRWIGVTAPRACSLLGAAGKLTGFEKICIPSCGNAVVDDGEDCDDGNADDFDSCRTDCTPGPTASEFVEIPSGATPANTPDGTPATAVDPSSTLATQFGSTSFDLNRALYTRYFIPGAGNPDAVLILIPGFAGGSGSFKYFAENLLAANQAAGGPVLEVWAFDRRTNLLEDDAGAVLADAENDPLLALDWYFGAELGLSLDPRLSRRAVFHAGPDVAFIANWTPHVFARDIDAVVETARTLPSAPSVFLGGHSLGTTFTARYAATDFDPGAGVMPGYGKLAGLVLLEGGGDSVPQPVACVTNADCAATQVCSAGTCAISDDALDRIIAKADGGLYHAVKNGDGRCVDGTPCDTICIGGPDDGQPCDPFLSNQCDAPGVCGGDDADCSAVPLPAGATANKCVVPVEAYTGANLNAPLVLVTPQVHAAGDIVGIQGKLDPHGLNLIQQDFGSGSAVQLVAGLGILDVLPPSSAETAVGFFLDDEFSPVTAFQASLGYSDNGLNLNLLGFVIPQPAFPPDPYRLWIDITEPMPTVALPDNGPPATPSSVNGQEKEVSRVDVMFSFLRAGARNFGDSYFASSGLSTTSELSAGGAVFGGGLDSSALSVGRGRTDIENLTEAGAIDIPVIAFGGTNGLTPTTASFEGFAKSIGVCTAPSCDGITPRVVAEPSSTSTTYGGAAGGFEVFLSEGYAHIDVVSAENDVDNNIVGPLVDFLIRNTP